MAAGRHARIITSSNPSADTSSPETLQVVLRSRTPCTVGLSSDLALTCRNQAAAGKKEIWQWTRNRDRLEDHSFPPPRRLHRAARSSKSRLRVRRKAERARAPCSGNYERTFSNKKNPLSTARFLSGRGKEWLTYLALDTGNTFRAVCGPAEGQRP